MDNSITFKTKVSLPSPHFCIEYEGKYIYIVDDAFKQRSKEIPKGKPKTYIYKNRREICAHASKEIS